MCLPSIIPARTSSRNTAHRKDIPDVDAGCESLIHSVLSSKTCLHILLLNFTVQLVDWANILNKGLSKSFTPESFTLPASMPDSGLQSWGEFLWVVPTSAALSLSVFGAELHSRSGSISVPSWTTEWVGTSGHWWVLLLVWVADFQRDRSCRMLEREANMDAPATAEASPALLSRGRSFPIPFGASAPLTATSDNRCWKIYVDRD